MNDLKILSHKQLLWFLPVFYLVIPSCTGDPFTDSIFFDPARARERIDAKSLEANSWESEATIERARLNQMKSRLAAQKHQGLVDKQTLDYLTTRVERAQSELLDISASASHQVSDHELEQRRSKLAAEVDRLDQELAEILEVQ